MLDIGWPEMLVIAIVLIVVVGPKDLPKMLRTFGKTSSSLRRMAGDFRKQFDEAMKEAELDEIKNLASDARKLNPASEIRKALNPMEQAARDVRSGLDSAMNPKKPAPSTKAVPAEPAKTGATALPGEKPPAAAAPKANGLAPDAPLDETVGKAAATPAATAPIASGPAASKPVPSKFGSPKTTAAKPDPAAPKPAPAKPVAARSAAVKPAPAKPAPAAKVPVSTAKPASTAKKPAPAPKPAARKAAAKPGGGAAS
jgi:sec-independent protein translocase protein TatB